MPNHHHRAGGLRQSNKRNKRSKASKRSVNRAMGGRVNASKGSAGGLISRSKADRRHMVQQKRAASRQAKIQRKRGIGGNSVPTPRVVGIISLGESEDIEERLRTWLLKGADRVARSEELNGSIVTAKYNVHKKDGALTYLTCSQASNPHCREEAHEDAAVLAALDLCRICDTVLFVVDGNAPNPEADVVGMHIGGDAPSVGTHKSIQHQDWDHLISRRGDRILTAVKGQGLPTPLTILANSIKDQPDDDFMTMQSTKSIRRSSIKRRSDLKHYISRFATTEFGPEKDKIVEIDLTEREEGDSGAMVDEDVTPIEARQKQVASAALVRTLCTMAATPPKWISDAPRAYLISESHDYNLDKQELSLTGFVRGQVPFDVNSLVHVPNLGTFACQSVTKAVPPLKEPKTISMMDESYVLYSDPNKRESLERFAAPDALEGEQNLVGFDEAFEQALDDTANAKDVERPAGWSDYQSAWLDAMEDIGDSEDEMDHGELARALNQKPQRSDVSVATGVMELDEDSEISPEERKALLEQRQRDKKEDLEFPDEVEVSEDVKASDRFARYRSLKSFRKSYWDPKENLPESYGSIFHFPNFKATQRDVLADTRDRLAAAEAAGRCFWGKNDALMEAQQITMEDGSEDEEDLLDGCVPSGSYVTILLEKVTPAAFVRVSSASVISAVALLPHENKVSVLHMGLCQSPNCEQDPNRPVKSKDVLTFRCGWRTWKARPVFSQNNLNSDTHKFERFLPQGGAFFAASVFGPVSYSPCPVLVFRERPTADRDLSSKELLGIGSMIGADADRISVKRIILTGFPVRVHKRYATVKYMFYNPDDVKWFKPAGLFTKHGLHGHIIESVGEHGTMKCLFNAPIKQHDTVCLPLYKRIYPKIPPNALRKGDDGATVRTSGNLTSLLVL